MFWTPFCSKVLVHFSNWAEKTFHYCVLRKVQKVQVLGVLLVEVQKASGMKLFLILSVSTFREQKHFPEHSRDHQILHNLPGLGPAPAVDGLQVRSFTHLDDSTLCSQTRRWCSQWCRWKRSLSPMGQIDGPSSPWCRCYWTMTDLLRTELLGSRTSIPEPGLHDHFLTPSASVPVPCSRTFFYCQKNCF